MHFLITESLHPDVQKILCRTAKATNKEEIDIL